MELTDEEKVIISCCKNIIPISQKDFIMKIVYRTSIDNIQTRIHLLRELYYKCNPNRNIIDDWGDFEEKYTADIIFGYLNIRDFSKYAETYWESLIANMPSKDINLHYSSLMEDKLIYYFGYICLHCKHRTLIKPEKCLLCSTKSFQKNKWKRIN